MNTGTASARWPAWLPLAALVAVLAAGLFFLEMKAQHYDSGSYFENVALLRQAKQIDAQWELDAMKSKTGINQSYDPLVDPLPELQTISLQLGLLAADPNTRNGVALARGVAGFQQALKDKSELMESFKSHNAVLRNSLSFLPTAADDIVRQAAMLGRQHDSASTGALTLLLATLVHTQGGAQAQEQMPERDIELMLAALDSLPARVPAAEAEKVALFAVHVRAVLREHDEVDDLLERIFKVPTELRIDELNQVLGAGELHAVSQLQRYRSGLLLFSLALVGLLIYAAARLIRSHRVINGVNQQLQHANDHLEQRVQQRTVELEQAQGQLLTAARQAGMAEVASNVLHNVGNVLNSVGVSAGMVSERVRNSKLGGLARAAALIDQHRADLPYFLSVDPSGKYLPTYLNSLAAVLESEQLSIATELAELVGSVDHIKDIVATQQSYAGASSLFERCRLADVADEAIRISTLDASGDRLAVARDYADLPLTMLDRHRVLQILINLLRNARQAADAAQADAHRVRVRLRAGAGGAQRVEVSDNGEGIAPENLTRIFGHGFTTRASGHGFGLHSCVLAARDMGGDLTVHSTGKGQGATFSLTLPAHGGEVAA